ncbi:ATP-binding protein [Streptomyces sp. NPDC057411]|uniref:ATP-binding protein n=1 Tax=unclassified Streptomyces TaxID=2593676 RepID=UPI00362860C0
MSEGTNAYDASRIQLLEGWEAVRKRPGMYVGSTGERGLRQMVFEVTDRAVNEVLAGRASRVDVTLTSDGGVRVRDDGPGLAVGDAAAPGTPGLQALLTEMQFGTGGHGPRSVSLGLWGAGPFVVNALSNRMTAEVRRDGARWVQEYARGVAVTPLTETGPATDSGTTLTFWPDAGIFGTAEFSFTELADRFRELAFLNREMDISLTDRRHSPAPRSVRFRFPGGARDFVVFLDAQEAAPNHAHAEAEADADADVSVIGFEREDPRMGGAVEVALRWNDSGAERVRSFANSLPTVAGTHVSGFRDGVAAAVNGYARGRRLLTAADPDLGSDRMGAGMTAVVSVKLDEPEFHGSVRNTLGGTAVRSCVEEAVRDHLGRWLEEHPEQAAAVVGRVVRGAAASGDRGASEAHGGLSPR